MADGAAYVDRALTNLTQAYLNDAADFMAEKLFPVVNVEKPTGKYWIYNKNNLLIPSSTLRTGRSETKEASFGKTLGNYGPLNEHALKDFISRDEYKQTDAPINVESDVVNFLNEKMLLAQENDLATQLSDTAIITNNTTLSGTSQWSDKANSNPFNDIKTAVIAMRGDALKSPNTVAFSFESWLEVIDHPDFLDRIKWSRTGVMTEADFIQLFAPYGITQVFIGKAQKNTATEGQTATVGSVWGKHVWVAYITPTPSLRAVNGGYTLRLPGEKYVDRWDVADPKGSWIRNNDYYDQMLFDDTCFYLIKNAVA